MEMKGFEKNEGVWNIVRLGIVNNRWGDVISWMLFLQRKADTKSTQKSMEALISIRVIHYWSRSIKNVKLSGTV